VNQYSNIEKLWLSLRNIVNVYLIYIQSVIYILCCILVYVCLYIIYLTYQNQLNK